MCVCVCVYIYTYIYIYIYKRRPWWLSWQRVLLQCGRPRIDPWVGKFLWKREWLPTPVFWPGEFHRLYSSCGRKQLDMTEWLSLSLSYVCVCVYIYIHTHTHTHTHIYIYLAFYISEELETFKTKLNYMIKSKKYSKTKKSLHLAYQCC